MGEKGTALRAPNGDLDALRQPANPLDSEKGLAPAAAVGAEVDDRVIGWLRATESFEELSVDLDETDSILWCLMHPIGRPSVTPGLAREARALQQSLRNCYVNGAIDEAPFRYLVWHSDSPGVFNLGGDLRLFAEFIRSGQREALLDYATTCVDVVYANAVSMELPIITCSLVQGDALGGGFEAAISSHHVIAERSAKFGLPEVLFNLFPGMGAYSLIARRVGAAIAERMIFSGKVYTAEELYEIGLVDQLAEDGMGQRAVFDFVEQASNRFRSALSIYRARHRVNPVSYQELYDITCDWVDAAMNLSEADLRRMERLAAAQDRRRAKSQSPVL